MPDILRHIAPYEEFLHVRRKELDLRTIKAELLILTGFIFILAGTIVLEKPFIMRIYEKAAAFGFLCDVAMPRAADFSSPDPCEGQSHAFDTELSEMVKARSYNSVIADTQSRHGFIYEDVYDDPAYDALLNGPSGMMCVIEIPSIHVLLPVGHGTGTDLLRDAAGHMHGTSLPIGGPSSHAVIAAHSGLVDRELFTHLPCVRIGDEFNIYVLGEKHTYRVDKISTVLPDDTEALSVADGRDMVTLMTCVPYGINTHRLFVRGERYTDETNVTASDLLTARRREYARSVLYIAGMFLLSAVETAIYAMHVYKVTSRIRQNRKRSIV